jgi:hypothetical protein
MPTPQSMSLFLSLRRRPYAVRMSDGDAHACVPQVVWLPGGEFAGRTWDGD